MNNANPITDRLDTLHDQWVSFAERPDARILVWLARADEAALIEAFVVQENDGAAAATPDIFLRLTTGFRNPAAHGYALREELAGYYEQIREELRTDGLDAAWQCPYAQKTDDDVTALLAALKSLHEHHASEGSILSVWLDPEEVPLEEEHLLWLQRLARQAPSELRFIVVDSASAPSCEPLLKAEPTRLVSERCDLDMPSALADLAQAAHDNAPTAGSQFRLLVTKLGAAFAKRELSVALPLAESALALAMANHWPHLAALVQLMLGGGYTALGLPLEAARAYTEAERLAEESEKHAAPQSLPDGEATDPKLTLAPAAQARQLRLHARFGQGATLIACGAWKQAAEVYLNTAPLAAALQDSRSELDCYRLASVCFERTGELGKAWDLGMRGMQLAQNLDAATRSTSTLAYLGDHLVRMTEQHSPYASYRSALHAQFTTMLGPDWRPKPVSGAAA